MTAASQAQGFALRQRLRRALPDVERAFESALDQVAPCDDVVHVDKLHLTIRVGADELDEALPRLLRQAVQEHLHSVLSPEPSAARPSGVRRATAAISAQQALMEYLKTGSLPWSLAGMDAAWVAAELAEAATHAAAVVDGAPRDVGLDGLCVFFFRLLQLLPDNRWLGVARAVSTGQTARHEDLLAALLAFAHSPSPRYESLRLASLAVATALATKTETSSPSFPHELAVALTTAFGEAPGTPVSAVVARLPPTARLFFARHLDALTPGGEPCASESPVSPVDVSSSQARAVEVKPAESRVSASTEQPLALSVSHAGLVLLHPFLPRFFEHVGVRAGSQPELPRCALPRAAALLHLLVTGDDEAPEWHLGLIKILIGLGPSSPLPIASGLVTPADREEAAQMLASVIDHWGALRRTPIESFRTSFLQRRGLLEETPRQWKLRVEPEAFDVLLSRLPWGIGMVKLPWMKKPILTEWPAP